MSTLLACMMTAAAFYGLPPKALPAIQRVEGGNLGTVSVNKDGSADLGVMQVNTRWTRPLAQHTGMTPVAVQQRLINDGCFNIHAAAAILRIYLNEARGDVMLAIGYYHSHTPERNQAYQTKVLDSARALFGTR